jgi:Histidine kinase-, DNA gyrase B-, and HSP90-like ATPase
MARTKTLPPSAASLTASLRDLGYSLETAIADLIDNSISAEATDIQIFCDNNSKSPVLVVADNGNGMNEDEVIAAMRHGATDPRKPRGPKDLGRFGLGLKTASFSQCRRLTVLSARNGKRAGAEWNLDQVETEDEWVISILEPDDIAGLPFADVLPDNGTLIIWRDLDRLFEDEVGHKRDEIVNEKLAAVERHLALVFHRFLANEVRGRKKLSIRLNGGPIEPFDPFCRRNNATQMLPEEIVWVNDVTVHMQPYILPHHSRLSPAEYEYYQNRSDFISNQGAYIYRNGRLMAWGDWFRLVPKGEATKLARVQIDFDNSLDEAWTIDIKKSRARPPHPVRERLRQIISKIAARSVTVHRGRGQRLFDEAEAPLWERYADRTGIRYAVNIGHPLIASLRARMASDDAASIGLLVEAIGSSLPVEMIYSDFSTNPREMSRQREGQEETIERLKKLQQVLFPDGRNDPEAFLRIVRSTHLFEGHFETVEKFIRGELS